MPDLTDELHARLGTSGLVRLAEEWGGQRLYVPAVPYGTQVEARLGMEAARRLAEALGGAYIRIPLARELRATVYRTRGMSNPDIARRLGITESGVNKLFLRAGVEVKAPPQLDTRQLDLFRDYLPNSTA